jgi:cytochrome b involved in lipid metabolism
MGNFLSSNNITIIDDNKYDMTELLTMHPGRSTSIKKIIGTDGTKKYRNIHGKKFNECEIKRKIQNKCIISNIKRLKNLEVAHIKPDIKEFCSLLIAKV